MGLQGSSTPHRTLTDLTGMEAHSHGTRGEA